MHRSFRRYLTENTPSLYLHVLGVIYVFHLKREIGCNALHCLLNKRKLFQFRSNEPAVSTDEKQNCCLMGIAYSNELRELALIRKDLHNWPLLEITVYSAAL